MEPQKLNYNEEVSNFLARLEHPRKAEIEALRMVILSANQKLTELIKWNAPSFCFEGEDRLTMRINPPAQLQVIFHYGAKVKQLPENKLITDNSGILSWKANDRAVATFKSMEDINTTQPELIEIINKWLMAASLYNSETGF